MKHLTNTTIQLAHEISQAHQPLSGAVVLFSGEVRATNKNKEVLWLEYEAYDEMAEEMIANIVDEAKKRWHLNYAACVHRTGKLEIGECAVVVVTSGGHRGAAYEANRYIIDEVKSHVPIWKHEFFADGTQEWGQNDCTCHRGHGKKMEKIEDTPYIMRGVVVKK